MRSLRRPARPEPPVRLEDPDVTVAIRRSKRARRLTLRLSAKGQVTVTAPTRLPHREVVGFVVEHRGWIAKRLAARPLERCVGPGDLLEVAGQTYHLEESDGQRLRLLGHRVLIPGDAAAFSTRLQAWVKERARAEAAAMLERHGAQLGRRATALTLRDPTTRWGSCTEAGRIMLSWRLALGPWSVFDYVAAHEVAHLAEMNHGPAFWRHVKALCPDYETHRDWLRREGASLHAIAL